jgi:hypothetical protein
MRVGTRIVKRQHIYLVNNRAKCRVLTFQKRAIPLQIEEANLRCTEDQPSQLRNRRGWKEGAIW